MKHRFAFGELACRLVGMARGFNPPRVEPTASVLNAKEPTAVMRCLPRCSLQLSSPPLFALPFFPQPRAQQSTLRSVHPATALAVAHEWRGVIAAVIFVIVVIMKHSRRPKVFFLELLVMRGRARRASKQH